MKIGICIEETWDFFKEIHAELEKFHQTCVFKRRELKLPFFRDRTNRYLFNRDLNSLMAKSDVVFFEWASHLLVAATHLPKTTKIVTRLHRYEMYQWVDDVNWNVVDKIILVSKAKQREFISKFPSQSDKTVVIPVGISLKKFYPMPKPFNGDLGILCHLTPRKRVYDLLMSFYELSQRSSDFHLHIAGGSHPAHIDYFNALHAAVRDLRLDDKVTFYNNVMDTSTWYHKIDIFISNSYSEGLQVAPMEAMASGCYCLAHHWSGSDELLPTDLLFYSSSELQQKILAYAANSEAKRQENKDRMREIVNEKFDIIRIQAQIRQVVEEVGSVSFVQKRFPL